MHPRRRHGVAKHALLRPSEVTGRLAALCYFCCGSKVLHPTVREGLSPTLQPHLCLLLRLTKERPWVYPTIHKAMLRFSHYLVIASLVGACAQEQRGPQVASSQDNPAYAVSYSSQLNDLRSRIEAQRTVAGDSINRMEQFAVQVGPSDPELVAELYQTADYEGRSEAYAARQSEEMVIRSFFTREEKPLTQRIAANAEYAAKQKQCEVSLYDASARGLQRGLDDQLKERRRETSAAQLTVQQKKAQLGQKAASLLPDQLDEISLTSYIVYISLEQDEIALAERAERIASIRSTLDDHRRALAAEPKPNNAELARVDDALVQLTDQESKIQETLKDVEARRQQLRGDYEKALEALIESARIQPPSKAVAQANAAG